MTAPKRYPYNFLYVGENNNDIVYTHNLSKKDFEKVQQCILSQQDFAPVEIGIVSLKGIRCIVEATIEEQKVDKPKEKYEGFPEMDAITLAWLNSQENMEEGDLN